MIHFYGIDPRSLRQIEQGTLEALIQQLPRLKAEHELVQADIIRWFSPVSGNKKEVAQTNRMRRSFIRKRRNILKQYEEDNKKNLKIKEMERVDFQYLSDDEKKEIEAWASSIGAVQEKSIS